jgi:hypothetical protein
MTRPNAKDAIVRVQPDSIVTTSFKNKSKVCSVICFLTRVSSKIVKVSFEYMLKIEKSEGHGMLEGCLGVFKAEKHFPVCKSTPRTNKCHLVLILGFNLNLVIP